jgi:hypothetical protein
MALPGPGTGSWRTSRRLVLLAGSNSSKDFAARRQASTPRRFHDVVLDDGAVTLPILAHNVRRWIATEQAHAHESRSTGFVQAAATILTL